MSNHMTLRSTRRLHALRIRQLVCASALSSAVAPICAQSMARWHAMDDYVARQDARLAQSPRPGEVIMFGGERYGGPEANFHYFGDTRAFDGVSWRVIHSSTFPSPRSMTAMTFDSNRNRIVLFGGGRWANWFDDTWEFDGTEWHRMTPAGGTPSARWAHDMVYDPARGVSVMFGGSRQSQWSSGQRLADLWEWDGTTWTQRFFGSGGPTGRESHAMCYSPAYGGVVLSGGWTGTALTQDLWTWNGTSWTLRSPAAGSTPPSARHKHSIISSPTGIIIMFGGEGHAGENNETWSWSPSTSQWSLLAQANSPTARSRHAMIFDPVRSKVIMTGGGLPLANNAGPHHNDTWEMDVASSGAMQWQPILPDTVIAQPSPRSSAAMCYDGSRQESFLFGGYIGGQSGTPTSIDDLWVRRGADWVAIPRGAGPWPGARAGAVAGYDEASQLVVMHGGTDPVGWVSRSETWTWNGSVWNQVSSSLAGNPFAQLGFMYAAMCYVPATGLIMFGGVDTSASWSASNDLYIWNGGWSLWTPPQPSVRPPARTSAAIAWDRKRSTAVMFGGSDTSGNPFMDTWEWAPSSGWVLRAIGGGPQARGGHSMAYDRHRERIVLFGGSGAGFSRLGDTWEWSGTGWIQVTPMGSPGTKAGTSMLYDVQARRLVVFGGNDENRWLNPTSWSLQSARDATSAPIGPGCSSSSTTPVLTTQDGSACWLGDLCRLHVSGLSNTPWGIFAIGFSAAAWGTTSLPMSLDGQGMPGCSLQVAPATSQFSIFSPGSPAMQLAVPTNPAFVGLELYFQAFVPDAIANVAGMLSSNGLKVVVGAR